jgi:hypothetical protein
MDDDIQFRRIYHRHAIGAEIPLVVFSSAALVLLCISTIYAYIKYSKRDMPPLLPYKV